MSKQKNDNASSQAQLDVLTSNLRFLNLDKEEGWSDVSIPWLASKDAGPNQKCRIQTAEWIFYHLFRIWDQQQTADKLKPFFPPLEPVQSLNLRAALFRGLNQLKTDGTLGKETVVRKTMFDDCKGAKFLELITSFSTIVLRKYVCSKTEGDGAVLRQSCKDGRVAGQFYPSSLPLAIAHRASLRSVLQRRAELRYRYERLSQTLDMKDREVDRRFEKIVERQDYLDQNIAPEATVARIEKQFNENWQGDEGYVKAITQGDQSQTTDALLDRPWHEMWSEVDQGTFSPDFTMGREGLIEDLEHRVAVQRDRLRQWKQYKTEMQGRGATKLQPASPVRKGNLGSPQAKAAEKQLVFTPRKSPRKSEFPLQLVLDPSPAKSSLEPSSQRQSPASSTMSKSKISPADFLKRRRPMARSSLAETPSFEANDSDFSEISGGELTNRLNLGSSLLQRSSHAPQQMATDEIVATDNAAALPLRLSAVNPKQSSPATPESSLIPPSPSQEAIKDFVRNTASDQPEAQQADTTAKPAPPSSKPILSLAERTRQSLALASPGARLTADMSPPKRQSKPPTRPSLNPSHATDPDIPVHANLADRTRKSISFAQTSTAAKARQSLGRRDSRIYPVNQFETPNKFHAAGGGGKELTPPEELFSPRAGYDSVFRSRPKVGLSPVATTTGDFEVVQGVEDEGGIGDGVGNGLGSSPLSRMAGKV